jgi:hypothetical protein
MDLRWQEKYEQCEEKHIVKIMLQKARYSLRQKRQIKLFSLCQYKYEERK